MKKFDAIIIGSGQAGNPLAHNLADKNWKVALIEKEFLGGSCVNYGCTPTKTMLASSQSAYSVQNASKLGVDVSDIKINLKNIVDRKNKMVEQWRTGQEKQTENRSNITLFYGHAKFKNNKQILINDDTLEADMIFINTGTSPRVLDIEGINDIPYLTNRNIMDLEEVPEHLIIIGGSYIGLEYGQMFRRFGSRVTIVENNDRIVSREDEDVSQSLMEALDEEGIQFLFSANTKEIKKDFDNTINATIELELKKEILLKGSHILLASGRKPNSENLGLENTDILVNNGFISVDKYLQTNVPEVYALGDIKGGPQFTHISYNDYQIVFNNIFNDQKKSTEDRIVPYTLFTDPELARVGLSENEAKEAGFNILVGKIPMSHVARAIEMGSTKGFMKIVINADNDQILGATILGVNGGEVIQTILFLMYSKVSWKILKGAVYIHPTLTEGFYGLMESVK